MGGDPRDADRATVGRAPRWVWTWAAWVWPARAERGPGSRPRRWVTVPDFGARLASERSLIAVRAGVRTRCVSTTRRPTGDGIVVAQDPPPGTRVRRGTEVRLTVTHVPADRDPVDRWPVERGPVDR